MLIIISIGVINPFWGRLFVLFCDPRMGVMMAHKNNGGAEMTAAAFVSHGPGTVVSGAGRCVCAFWCGWGVLCGPVRCCVRFIFMFWRSLGHCVIPEIFKCFFVCRKCGADNFYHNLKCLKYLLCLCVWRIFCNELFLFEKNDSSPRPSGGFYRLYKAARASIPQRRIMYIMYSYVD